MLSKLSWFGNYQGNKLIMYLNFSEFELGNGWSAGWQKVEVPIKNRKRILDQLDYFYKHYAKDSVFRVVIGETVEICLKDIQNGADLKPLAIKRQTISARNSAASLV